MQEMPETITLDPEHCSVALDDSITVPVSPIHMRLLLAMLALCPPGHTISPERLYRRVWDREVSGSNVLEVTIHGLHEQLGFRLVGRVVNVGRFLPAEIEYRIKLPDRVVAAREMATAGGAS